MWKTNVMGHDNPHAVFELLRAQGTQAVLLENGWGGGEWSFVGVVDEKIQVPRGEKGLLFIRDFIKRKTESEKRRKNKKPKARKLTSAPFQSGFVGFLSYELGAKWQGIEATGNRQRGTGRRERTRCPEAYFVYVDKVYAFKNSETRSPLDPSARLRQAQPRVRDDKEIASLPLVARNDKRDYFKKIAEIKKYLYAGETYQVNFSQRFEAPYHGEPFDLYKKLTAINPSSHQFFIETKEFALISNSPEKLFSLSLRGAAATKQSRKELLIETRPIKGTIPRGQSATEDRQNIKKLLNSTKDEAELAMIVDLERNDLGRVCRPGTVRVLEPRAIKKCSHVIHTIATIQGVLADQYDWFDAMRALFPGGSVTGCPKKRTMEIIDGLENFQRGAYCGSAGFIDLSGQCEFNIMIRTAYVDKSRESPIIVFGAGGGIVSDSQAKSEYDELLYKAAAFLQSTDLYDGNTTISSAARR